MGVMGHHFTDVFKDDKYFELRLIPFYVIWFLFGIVLIDRESPLLRRINANHL